MKNAIEISHLTKDYGNGRGVFDVSLTLAEGEMLGFVGANGAGKTTTIRNVMGFLKPDSGTISVHGLDSWRDSDKIKNYIGYVPGEIAFPDLGSGTEFIKSQAEFLKISDLSFANSLIERLQLDVTANLKRMSKGMKQKTALVVALMANPDILILDEPTTGLDPLMRVEFMKILTEESQKGKTILISSHLYEELENTCDKVALIDKGKIVQVVNMDEIKNRDAREFKIEFANKKDFSDFSELGYTVVACQKQFDQVTISIEKTSINKLFRDLKLFDVKFIAEVKYTLEKHFNEVIKQKETKND